MNKIISAHNKKRRATVVRVIVLHLYTSFFLNILLACLCSEKRMKIMGDDRKWKTVSIKYTKRLTIVLYDITTVYLDL